MDTGGVDVGVHATGVPVDVSRWAGFKWSKEMVCGFPFTVTVTNFGVLLMTSKGPS